MHSRTAGQAGVPGEQLAAGVKTFIREGGQKANICIYYTPESPANFALAEPRIGARC
jgi:hypothetical protein